MFQNTQFRKYVSIKALVIALCLFFILSLLPKITVQKTTISAAPNSPKLYVPVHVEPLGNSNVLVIDTSNNSVITNIPVGGEPFDAKISPDTTRVYVANKQSNSITVIDTTTNTIITTIPLGGGSPVSMSLNDDGTRLYTANDGIDSIVVVDIVTNAVINTIPVGSTPTALAAKPNSTLVYVAMSGGDLIIIDENTSTIVDTIRLGGIAYQGMLFNVSGTHLYLTNDTGIALAFDASSNTEITKFLVSPALGNPVFNPDESIMYSTGTTCSVSVINAANNQWIEALPGSMQGGCGGLAVLPSGKRLYVSITGAYTLSEMSDEGDTLDIIPVGGAVKGMVIKP